MRSLDIHNYILMGFYINECFYEKFGYTIQNYILMGFYINESFYEKFGHTQLYSNGIQYSWSFYVRFWTYKIIF